METIYWYDLETFGIDSKRDRIAQFAGVRTDTELNVIDNPLIVYCKPCNDYLPDPRSCLVTKITPQSIMTRGIPESEFVRRIHNEFSRSNTCVAGYNNIRFDDEFIRNALYRNFYDPYEREWKNGNSRWDIIDVLRLTRALRPTGIRWPDKEDGIPSFRLEDLTAANEVQHRHAHDALSDVEATIAVAKLIKVRQPKLYDYVFKNRSKQVISALLNVRAMQPVVHVSSKYPAAYGCIAVVVALCRDPQNANGVIVYDLRYSPQELLNLPAQEIKQRLFTTNTELEQNSLERIHLKTVHTNKCPIVVPLNTLDTQSAQRLNIDLAQCFAHLSELKAAPQLGKKLEQVYADGYSSSELDPEFQIYNGFFTGEDRAKMQQVRDATLIKLTKPEFVFQDKRLDELLFRYRARNFPQSLSEHERQQWESYRRERLSDPAMGNGITVTIFHSLIKQLQQEHTSTDEWRVLSELEQYAHDLL